MRKGPVYSCYFGTPRPLPYIQEPGFQQCQPEKITDVISQSLIITTNLPFESWTEVCGSERMTGAMLDRLTHRVHIIEANGQSYRFEQSRKRLAKQKIKRQD